MWFLKNEDQSLLDSGLKSKNIFIIFKKIILTEAGQGPLFNSDNGI